MGSTGKKVLVAMSGGVDSSVAAALLKEQGYFVTGGFMKNFSSEAWEGIIDDDCPWEEDWADVQAVCKKLDAPCRSFNFELEYEDRVINYFFKEYAQGRTPNPDVMCNKEIKFKMFLDQALELGFDYIATGHYARIIPRYDSVLGIKYFELSKGVDPKKDQSYFLYALDQEQLSKSLFPIGEYAKPEIRALARKFELPNAEKKDSQGICFVGKVRINEFLKQRIPERVGQVVDTAGNVVGEHDGAAYYTFGQRHGLDLGGRGPFFILSKDMQKNEIVVTNEYDHKELFANSVQLKDIHWITDDPELPLKCKVQVRYHQEDQDCELIRYKDGYIVNFANRQRTPTVGQSAVFYDEDTLLGGGVIETIK